MASNEYSCAAILRLGLLLTFFLQGVLGGTITCERLSQTACAFAVSSAGARCVLEKQIGRGGSEEYVCRTSAIRAARLSGWIETDDCVEACGVDRASLGISSDSLLESRFTQKLCSPRCYQACPNIVDLYFNLAAGEGMFLPKLCEEQNGRTNVRRVMAEMRSSGMVAPGPEPGKLQAAAPAKSATLLASGPSQA
uniref:tRNA modification GTPase MnmE n=1 Tax=Anthurium amnicola TaxID=1678845 RepID=A0A1D1YII9_9ARAE